MALEQSSSFVGFIGQCKPSCRLLLTLGHVLEYGHQATSILYQFVVQVQAHIGSRYALC